MRRRRPGLLALAVAVALSAGAAGAEPAPESVWQTPVVVDLAAVDLPPEILGDGWVRSAGLRIDDVTQLAGLAGLERSIAAGLAKKLGPLGVRGVGDYSLARKAAPANLVSVRVYRFRTVEACRTWWQQKYRYEGWEQHYEALALEGLLAVDSRQMSKRAVAFGNLWLTAHQLGEGDEHLKALDHLVVALRSGPVAYTSPP